MWGKLHRGDRHSIIILLKVEDLHGGAIDWDHEVAAGFPQSLLDSVRGEPSCVFQGDIGHEGQVKPTDVVARDPGLVWPGVLHPLHANPEHLDPMILVLVSDRPLSPGEEWETLEI